MCKKYLTEPREIRDTERMQRGCHYCIDSITPIKKINLHRGCPYEECPYHELDDVQTYGEYLMKSDKNGLLKILELLE